MRTERGLEPVADKLIRDNVSGGARAMVAANFNMSADDDGFESLRLEFLERYQSHCAVLTRPFDGIGQLLNEIEQAKMIWGVATNKPVRYAEPIMQQLSLAERSAVLVCPDHVSRSKPDPEMILLACEKMGVAPSATLFVGDDERDIEAGRAAGCKTAAVSYGYIHPQDNPRNWGADVVVDSPMELRDVLERAQCGC
jgi:phosphoglycolate phosphatase-like HAD superfamily hydrolase